MAEAPSWRKIETALIELLREEGFNPVYIRGDTYILLYDESVNWHEICVGDLARALANRL